MVDYLGEEFEVLDVENEVEEEVDNFLVFSVFEVRICKNLCLFVFYYVVMMFVYLV